MEYFTLKCFTFTIEIKIETRQLFDGNTAFPLINLLSFAIRTANNCLRIESIYHRVIRNLL